MRYLNCGRVAACLIAVGIVSLCSAPVLAANFVVNSAGPHNSFGLIGDAGNAVLFPTYAGAAYPANKISIQGTLTKVEANSLASDSTWHLKASTGTGTAFSFSPQITFTGAYTTLNLSSDTFGLFWIKNYPQYRFEAHEGFFSANDQPGLDAQWTNMTFEFHTAVPIISTGGSSGTSINLDTLGSNFNTSLAIYSTDGELLGFDDGTMSGTSAQLDAGSLAAGSYYLVAGGSSSVYQDDSATPGTESGNLLLTVNGDELFNGALDSERFEIINLTIVPEPSSLLLMTLGAAATGIVLRGRPGNS